MPHVYLPIALRRHTGGLSPVEVPGDTVQAILLALEQRYPPLQGRLRDGHRLKSGLAVAVNSTILPQGLQQAVPADAEVHFIPAIAGG